MNATVCEKDKCAGCMACIEKCPRDAIHIEDSLCALNAVIDAEKCVGCQACHQVCPVNNTPELRQPILWKQGWSNHPEIRKESSSGGAATEIERRFLEDGGTVFTCKAEGGEFVFRSVGGTAELSSFMGSKYVKSNPAGVYQSIGECLKRGEKVLFVGLPCQAAAVRNFFRDPERLTTADLICHGTPSPGILAMFLREKKIDIGHIGDIRFREKTRYGIRTQGKRLAGPGRTDFYIKAFLDCLDLTENCYSCPFARTERVSDITLGDSWGSELSNEEKDKGISLFLCQTQKGLDLIKACDFTLLDVDPEKARRKNDRLTHPAEKPENRRKFVRGIFRRKSFHRVMAECYPKGYFKDLIKGFLFRLHMIKD